MTRVIGIQHRIKRTAEGEAHPTRIAIRDGDDVVLRNLDTENDELAFLEEIQPGDKLVFILGGSGGYFALAANRVARERSASVVRIPPFHLKDRRGNGDISKDSELLAELAILEPSLFTPVHDREEAIILVRERNRELRDTIKARIACQQRLYQRVIGMVFLQPSGIYPEGAIEKRFDEVKASDTVLNALELEEGRAERALAKALDVLDVHHAVFAPVEGCGVRVAGGLISAIEDIRRFDTPGKLVAYCGVHVLPDNIFPRKRTGQVANWHSGARQTLVQFGEQCNRRPESEWGKRLRANKARILEDKCREFPAAEARIRSGKGVEIDGRNRWYTGHIHKTGIWRTLTQFVGDHIYPEWRKVTA